MGIDQSRRVRLFVLRRRWCGHRLREAGRRRPGPCPHHRRAGGGEAVGRRPVRRCGLGVASQGRGLDRRAVGACAPVAHAK
jgi:hypothetical protein